MILKIILFFREKRSRGILIEWISRWNFERRLFIVLCSELDTTKGDGGWCIVPPLSVLYKYSHAYKRSYDCANLAIAPAASRNKCAFGQSSSYPRWRWRRRGWLSAAVNPVEPRGRQDLGWSLSRQSETLWMEIMFINQETFTLSKTTNLCRWRSFSRRNRSSFICVEDRDLQFAQMPLE